jgi:hypothetical protein
MLRDGGARSDALHRAFADFCEDRAPGLLRLRKNEQEKLLAWRNDLAHHARSLSREEAESRYQTIKEAVGVVVGSNKRSTAGPDAD